jgi:RNA polymerase sigma-70 factor (ECF subfamily)
MFNDSSATAKQQDEKETTMARPTKQLSCISTVLPSDLDGRKMTVEADIDAGTLPQSNRPGSLLTDASVHCATRRDQRLVYAAQSGSRAAFDELVNLYSRRVHRTVLAITKNSEDAEDAMQESFLRAFLAISRFEGRASFYSWLTRIAINSALMILRRRCARSEFSLDTPQQWSDEIAPMDFEDLAPNPEETYYHRQRHTRLTRAIRRLSPNLREIVQARVVEECSVREVAEKFNISEAAAKSGLYRARTRLGYCLPLATDQPRQ